jgi:alpha-tubulin suppressor-like RCC1 family protein
MTVGVKSLVDAVNTSISTAEQPLKILQLSSVSKDFEEVFVYSVANCAALPSASLNKGRMVYLEDRGSYRISDGVSWTNDFTSQLYSCALSWGLNTGGTLGDNTSATTRLIPVSVVGGFTDWCQVSAGGAGGVAHSLGVRINGTAWAWGTGGYGRLGDNTTVNKSSPVSVVGGFTDWCQASAGISHSLGVRSNGTAWAWGQNNYGRLGDNTTVNKSSPVSVVGGFTDWCQVSAGGFHSLGVRQNGTAWAWGSNTCGRLGDGTTISKSSPVSVVGGFTDWCQLSGGRYHSLGVRINGTAWAWGSGVCGRLGNNNTFTVFSPVSVVGGFTDWCQVSAGLEHSLGVRTNGSAWAWGCNGLGRLGDNTTTNRLSPVSVVGGFTDWCQVSAGGSHSLGVRTNGTAWAWGCNLQGQLGELSTISRSSPVSVIGESSDWYQVSAGYGHSLGLRSKFTGF